MQTFTLFALLVVAVASVSAQFDGTTCEAGKKYTVDCNQAECRRGKIESTTRKQCTEPKCDLAKVGAYPLLEPARTCVCKPCAHSGVGKEICLLN